MSRESSRRQFADTDTNGCRYWGGFHLDKDGNVYIEKSETNYTAAHLLAGDTIVSWNKEGEIRFELSLHTEEFQKYDHKSISLLGISEDGNLLFSLTDEEKVSIIALPHL